MYALVDGRMKSYVVEDVPSYPLETVAANESLLSALETMFESDFTQLGIQDDGKLIGMVSYRSIARVLKIMRKMGIDKNLTERSVTIAIEDVEPVVEPSDDLVSLFDLLAEHPYVLVKSPEGEDVEILTDYDLLHFLRDSSEPFLLIEEIERSVRQLMRSEFSGSVADELVSAFEGMEMRTPERISDCSFGHYPVFISKNWDAFSPHFEENRDFVTQLLNEVGDVRNKLFHFRTERGDGDVDYELLEFAHGYFDLRTANSIADQET